MELWLFALVGVSSYIKSRVLLFEAHTDWKLTFGFVTSSAWSLTYRAPPQPVQLKNTQGTEATQH